MKINLILILLFIIGNISALAETNDGDAVRADNLVLADDFSIASPNLILNEQINHDVNLIELALQNGYVGRHFVPRNILDKALQGISNLRNLNSLTPIEFCRKIGDVLSEIPDFHLSAILLDNENGRCGTKNELSN